MLATSRAGAVSVLLPSRRGTVASKNPPEAVREGLTRASGFLRGEVGRRLGLRHAPKLEFEFDDSFEKAAKLTELIDRAPK